MCAQHVYIMPTVKSVCSKEARTDMAHASAQEPTHCGSVSIEHSPWLRPKTGVELKEVCFSRQHVSPSSMLFIDTRPLCRCVREADFWQEATWLSSSHPHKCSERAVACASKRKLAFSSIFHALLGGAACPAFRTTTASDKSCTIMASLQQPLHTFARTARAQCLTVLFLWFRALSRRTCCSFSLEPL
jgi:hypothetical protein